MLVFRYGQGADYWGYRNIYADAPWKRGFPLFWYTRDLHSELGFRFCINIFTALGISHVYFYGLWSIIMMTFISIGIQRNSPRRMLSLLLLYPTVGLTYLFSGVRAGMMLAIIFCFGIPAIQKKQWIRYTVIILICALFHSSALFLLITIPVLFIPSRKVIWLAPVAVILGLLITYTPIHTMIGNTLGGSFERIINPEISWLGLAERTVMFGLITAMYLYQKEERSQSVTCLYNIYILGYCIAWGGMVSAYISQRASVPFKAMELFLFPILIANSNKEWINRLLTLLLIGISSVMVFKNLNAYFADKSAFEYHYVGIWEEKNELLENWIIDVTRWAENTYNENP
ncbi:MAG: EpsG family protein [Lachnospiraceae bacterium]|nr:EpsG family protein [Lachnospiraceae bacterium]